MKTPDWPSKKSILIAIAIALFLICVYPTPFKFYTANGRLMRVNRITGTTQISTSEGWQPAVYSR